jgi:hypothetical protein
VATGWTGAYRDARGWLHQVFKDNGEVVFTFHLLPSRERLRSGANAERPRGAPH